MGTSKVVEERRRQAGHGLARQTCFRQSPWQPATNASSKLHAISTFQSTVASRTEQPLSLPNNDSPTQMYTSLRLRSQASLEDLCEAFDDLTWERLVLNNMAQRALTTPDMQSYAHSMGSTVTAASTASMRSRTPADAFDRPFTPPDGDGGNVKVVVRVRKFIKRGMGNKRKRKRSSLTQTQSWTTINHALST